MTVDSRPFVVPSFAQCRVHPQRQNVFSAKVGEIGNVEAERSVPAKVPAEIKTIEDHNGIAKYAVKFHRDTFASVTRAQIKNTAIPANACIGIVAADRLSPVGGQFMIVFKRKFHCPVMGKVDQTPGSIIKLQLACLRKITTFCERPLPCGSPVTKVLGRIDRMS